MRGRPRDKLVEIGAERSQEHTKETDQRSDISGIHTDIFSLAAFAAVIRPGEFCYLWALEELRTRSLGPEIRLILPPW